VAFFGECSFLLYLFGPTTNYFSHHTLTTNTNLWKMGGGRESCCGSGCFLLKDLFPDLIDSWLPQYAEANRGEGGGSKEESTGRESGQQGPPTAIQPPS
jgi:hypothetical protein